ncbi:MAG: divergent polysaccharide deacetylase family protein [Parvibaculum sp.]
MSNRMPIEKSPRRRGPSILLLAAAIVACLYGGVAVWLALTGDGKDGKPVVELKLAPDPAQEKQAAAEIAPPVDLRTDKSTDDTDETPGATPLPADAANADMLTSAELSLLEAAQKLNGANNAGDDGAASDSTVGDIKIVGAESVSGGPAPVGPLAPVAPLKPVPDPALIEKTSEGPLPIIGKDGRKPYQVYARPLPANISDGPRIALVVSGLGISESATKHAIEVLPPEVTLSFAPYGDGLQGWIDKAREAGHEVLLELPMEPFGYPQNDPGPYTLLTSLSASENVSRLQWLLSRFTGYVGVMNYQGARFVTDQSALSPILSALKSRGLMYVDNGATSRSLVSRLAPEVNLPFTTGVGNIDLIRSNDMIADSFTALEKSARAKGPAIGIASGFPITVDAIADWAKTIGARGITLVPVSATLDTN